MDEPIIYPRYKVSRDGSNLYLRLFVALANDEKDEFMRLIKDPGFEEVRDSFTANSIFSEDALEIAITVFNGKTKGLIDIEDVLKDGMTPLHLAVIHRAPRLTKYLLQRGDKVDAICDHKKLNLEHATPIDLSICNIAPGYRRTLFDILWRVCFHNRDQMEIIRMLVRSKQNTTWSSHTVFNYAYKGELHKLAALFLAVPELFLSSQESGELSLLNKLDLKLNSLENKTDNEKLLSLLLDVFALVGVKLATYIRLEEFAVKSRTKKEIDQTHLEIDFFLREVARKKLGVLSPDYYLRFFEAMEQKFDDEDGRQPDLNECTSTTEAEALEQKIDDDDDEEDGAQPDLHECTIDIGGNEMFYLLPYLLTRKDFERTDIYRLIPSLECQDAARLTRAIEKKLSSESAFLIKTSAKKEKHQLVRFPMVSSRSFEPSVRSIHTSADSANPMFGVEFTPNKVMQSSKLKCLKDFVKLSHFPLVAKRLLK